MKNLIAAATIALAPLSSAQAASVTINFEATGLSGTALAYFGLTASDTVTGTLTYDMADPDQTSDQGSYNSQYYLYNTALDADLLTTITINGVTYSLSGYVEVRDGIENRTGTTTDAFTTRSYLSPEGSYANQLFLDVSDKELSTWSGFDPSVEELNSGKTYFTFSVSNGNYGLNASSVTFSEAAAAVPVPMSALLLGTGLVGLGAMRRRAA